ncbi:MAG: peptidase M23, partial [Acidimicrobiales bacterium]
ERRSLAAGLEEARAAAETERRRLAAAFQADQEEIDRVRRLEMETRARLVAEIADLERRRDQLAAGER